MLAFTKRHENKTRAQGVTTAQLPGSVSRSAFLLLPHQKSRQCIVLAQEASGVATRTTTGGGGSGNSNNPGNGQRGMVVNGIRKHAKKKYHPRL